VGAATFGGAATGFAAGGLAAAAGFVPVSGVVGFSEGALESACTEPDAVAFTPPESAGLSADGFGSPSGVNGEGDLVSSGILRDVTSSTQRISERTITFISLRARCQRRGAQRFKENFVTSCVEIARQAGYPCDCA
jgi:hypothetical protein